MIEILQEVTEWQDNTPNHVYHVNGRGKLVAYVLNGEGAPITLKTPLTFDKRYRKFKKLGTIDEALESNAKVVQGSNGKSYIVQDGKCSCPGFKFRGQCKHVG